MRIGRAQVTDGEDSKEAVHRRLGPAREVFQALRMFERLIRFIPEDLSPTCQIRITSAAGEPVLIVFLPALASEERFRRVAGAQASTHRGPR